MRHRLDSRLGSTAALGMVVAAPAIVVGGCAANGDGDPTATPGARSTRARLFDRPFTRAQGPDRAAPFSGSEAGYELPGEDFVTRLPPTVRAP